MSAREATNDIGLMIDTASAEPVLIEKRDGCGATVQLAPSGKRPASFRQVQNG
jgi:hypothetical protein